MLLDHTKAMDVYDLIRPFYEEGHWSECGKFSPENTMLYIMTFLSIPEARAIGHYHEGKLVGLCVVEICLEFHTQPMGYITNFYTCPSVRKMGIDRKLIVKAIELCKDCDCLNVYAANTGIRTERANNLFNNLLSKFGFKKMSNIMIKELQTWD